MRYTLFFIIISFSLSTKAQKLVKVKLADNLSIKLPDDFTPMTKEDRDQRYESFRIPIALYTSPDRMVDFGINRSYSIWQENDFSLLEEFYKASIIELYDKVKFINKGTTTVNKREYVFFEFESIVYPANKFQGKIAKYSYLMYTIDEGTTYLFNFTCPIKEKGRWQEKAHQIMASIKLK